MITTIDVIDTVVKIGLGALISGVTSYIVTGRNHDHILEKAAADESASILREGALKLEKSSSCLNSAIDEFDFVVGGNNGSDLKKSLDFILSAYNEGKDAKALFFLIGEKSLGDLVEAYLKVLQTIRELIGDKMGKTLDKNALSEQSERAQSARQAILNDLGRAYQAIRCRK